MRLPSKRPSNIFVQMNLTIVDVTDVHGEILSNEWLAKSESTHRQLRPQIPKNYLEKMNRVFAGGGRMCVAVEDKNVIGVAVYRIYENTFCGVHMYVDDLITDEAHRSKSRWK